MPQVGETGKTLDSDLEIIRSLSPLVRDPGRPGLVILYGLPCSGKSYFGELVAQRCGAVVLNSDHHRRAIVQGIPRYNGPENQRLFDALNCRTEELLDQGQVVVFDSSAIRDWIRRPLETIVRNRGLRPVRVHLDPPERIVLARLDSRKPAPEPVNDAKTWRNVYEWMQPAWEPIAEPHLRLVDPGPVDEDVETVCRMLEDATDYPP